MRNELVLGPVICSRVYPQRSQPEGEGLNLPFTGFETGLESNLIVLRWRLGEHIVIVV